VSPRSRATVAYVAAFAAVGANFPYLPVHYRALGLDLAAIGMLAALWAGASLVASPLWGSVTDRFPRSRAVLPAAALLAAVAATGLSQAQALPAIAAGVACVAVATAGVTPMLDARTLDILGDDRAGYGRIRAWGSISFVVSTALVGFLIGRAGTQALFAAWIPALLVTALIALGLPRSRRASATGSIWSGASRVVRAPGLGAFLAAAFVMWAATAAISSFLSVRLYDLGAGAEAAGAAWVVGSVVEIPIMFAFPRLSARFGSHRLLVVGAASFAARGILYAVAGTPEVLVAGAVLEGMGYGLFFVASVGYVAELAPPRRIATAQGVLSAVTFGLASITGASVGGVIASVLTIPGLFAVAAVVGVAAVLGVILALRAAPRHAAAVAAPVDSAAR
jgi:PPP family 3-phenylpropionic acid transporter